MIASIEVDLGAVVRNLEALSRLVAPARLSSVVKANAYGHGLTAVAQALAPHSTRLSVYSLDEAVILRNAGINAPVHILGPIAEQDLETAHTIGAHITLWDNRLYSQRVAAIARRQGRRFAVHAKVDTGAVRLGIEADRAPAILARYAETSEYDLSGAFTLLARAEEEDVAFTQLQLARFLRATRNLDRRVERHAAATIAAILRPDARLDAVRIGIGLYGLWPSAQWDERMRQRGLILEPALSWRTRIVALHEIEAETSVGYGRAWRAARRSRIATLPIGYADGLPRAAGNSAQALVRGLRVPVVGRVCMNMAFLDVTDVAGVAPNQVVTLIGTDGSERIRAEELAAACGTISYEIVSRIPASVPRAYFG